MGCEGLLCELIELLLAEREDADQIRVPQDVGQRRALARALLNVREPKPAAPDLLEVQDAYLAARLTERGVTRPDELETDDDGMALWRGDITTLAADAIVNAANAQLLGCFVPGHACIDNAIHTYAGLQLRLECAAIRRAEGRPEPTGRARVTDAYNLPARSVIHTVGPIVQGVRATARDECALRSCYRASVVAAHAAGLGSVALCCISTGVFRYPARDAARVAVDEVRNLVAKGLAPRQVIFNVFTDRDERIYRELLHR